MPLAPSHTPLGATAMVMKLSDVGVISRFHRWLSLLTRSIRVSVPFLTVIESRSASHPVVSVALNSSCIVNAVEPSWVSGAPLNTAASGPGGAELDVRSSTLIE